MEWKTMQNETKSSKAKRRKKQRKGKNKEKKQKLIFFRKMKMSAKSENIEENNRTNQITLILIN